MEACGGNGEARLPPAQGDAAAAPVIKAKVRPIQMGEFLRKCACRRLLQVATPDIGKVMWTMRQLGVGAPGGPEALALLHQLLYEAWQGANCLGRSPGSRSMRKIASVAWSGRQSGRQRWKRFLDTSWRFAGSTKRLLPSCSLESFPCPKTDARNKAMSMAPSSARSLWDK